MNTNIAIAHLILLGEELIAYETIIAYQGKLIEVWQGENLITLPAIDSLWCDLRKIAPKNSFSLHWDTGGLFSPDGEYVSSSEWIASWGIDFNSLEWQSGGVFAEFISFCEQEQREISQQREAEEASKKNADLEKVAKKAAFEEKVNNLINQFFSGKDIQILKSEYPHAFSTTETHTEKCKGKIHLAGVKFFWKSSFTYKTTFHCPESPDGFRSSGISESWEKGHIYISPQRDVYEDHNRTQKEFIIPYPTEEEYAKYLAKEVRRWAKKLVKDGYSDPSEYEKDLFKIGEELRIEEERKLLELKKANEHTAQVAEVVEEQLKSISPCEVKQGDFTYKIGGRSHYGNPEFWITKHWLITLHSKKGKVSTEWTYEFGWKGKSFDALKEEWQKYLPLSSGKPKPRLKK